MRPHLVLTFDFPPMGGGIARLLAEVARFYPPNGMVISTGAWPNAAQSDATVPQRVDRLSLDARRLRTLPGLIRWSHRAEQLARTLNPEFIWCGNVKPAGYPARWVHARYGTPYGIIFYGTDLLKLRHKMRRSRVRRRAARLAIESAAVLVAISRWTAERCEEVLEDLELGSHHSRLKVVVPGTEPTRFRPGLDTSAVRARFGLEPQARWLLTVARLVEHKGIDNGIRAFARLAPQYPELRYAIAGEGEWRPALESLAKELGVADRVRFLGPVSEAELPAVFNVASVFLGVSRQMHDKVEGFGIALVEASACGVPVVGARAGGIPDAVREGETGLLTEGEDPTAIAHTLSRLLDDEELRHRLGEGGRKAVETWYNWSRVTRELRELAAGLG